MAYEISADKHWQMNSSVSTLKMRHKGAGRESYYSAYNKEFLTDYIIQELHYFSIPAFLTQSNMLWTAMI